MTAVVPLARDSASGITLVPADTTNPIAGYPSDKEEPAAIRTAEGRVSRVGRELRVQLLDGRTLVYDWDGQQYQWHRYAGYIRTMRSHVIHLFGMEGSGAHFIVDDSTGDSVKVWGKPIVSPDGTRFAIMSMAGEADYDPTLIEIWQVLDRKPRREFSLEPEGFQPSDPVWRDSTTVDFIKHTYVESRIPDDPWVKTPGRLLRTGDNWVLTEP